MNRNVLDQASSASDLSEPAGWVVDIIANLGAIGFGVLGLGGQVIWSPPQLPGGAWVWEF